MSLASCGIIYSVVSRGTTVLAQFSLKRFRGNFQQIAHHILAKINNKRPGKMSYQYDNYFFHYMVFDSIIFMCMADDAFGRRLPFQFLEDIKERLTSSFTPTRYKKANSYDLDKDFRKTLKTRMDFFSNDPEADKVRKLRLQVDTVRTTMISNIDKLILRGEKIDLLVNKTGNLHNLSNTFSKKTTELKSAMWWKNVKLMLIIVFILGMILAVFAFYLCGIPFLQNCIGLVAKVV